MRLGEITGTLPLTDWSFSLIHFANSIIIAKDRQYITIPNPFRFTFLNVRQRRHNERIT
jgi:hypothetical protein